MKPGPCPVLIPGVIEPLECEHDIIVRMPPVKEYSIRVKIKSIKKGTPLNY